MIQGSINQLITLAATAARLSPDYEKKAELGQIKKQMAGYKKQTELWDKKEDKTNAELEAENVLAEDIVRASARRLSLNPTEETFRRHVGNLRANERFTGAYKQYKAAEEDRLAKETIRQQERETVRKALLANAPQPKMGVRK